MAIVFIPALWRDLAGSETEIEAQGQTVRQVIDSLEQRVPGLRERLMEGERLRTNVSVAVDGEITPLGLREPVAEKSEIHFITAIKGGSAA